MEEIKDSQKTGKLSNQPVKGTSDWFPEEYKIRKYIFDTWREVCIRFGYQEYLTPLLESADVYRAKSGEDVGGKELMTMVDRAGRELSIRPEMTPSVVRMVSRIYESEPKPIRYSSIANFVRNEKPQRGRNREFWQLNYDIFGTTSVNSDIEIAQMGLEITLAFKPPKNSFTMFLNNRKLVDQILEQEVGIPNESRTEVVRTLDKSGKLSQEKFVQRLSEAGLNEEQIQKLSDFLKADTQEALLRTFPNLEENQGLLEIRAVVSALKSLGYSDWIKFQPNIIRGFDYYDGMVFEVFDNNPENNRSMFGGGRYDGLAGIFGEQSFPGVGIAPGDETTKLFLESWGLTERILEVSRVEKYYIPLLSEELSADTMMIAQKLRSEGNVVELGVEVEKVGKALSYADKTDVAKVVIYGDLEKTAAIYKIKDMKSGEESESKIAS